MFEGWTRMREHCPDCGLRYLEDRDLRQPVNYEAARILRRRVETMAPATRIATDNERMSVPIVVGKP